MNITSLKEKVTSGQVTVLKTDRKKTSNRLAEILSILSHEALTIEELVEKVGGTNTSIYNNCRRYERKLGLLVALNINGKTRYLSKKTALELGLIGKESNAK